MDKDHWQERMWATGFVVWQFARKGPLLCLAYQREFARVLVCVYTL